VRRNLFPGGALDWRQPINRGSDRAGIAVARRARRGIKGCFSRNREESVAAELVKLGGRS